MFQRFNKARYSVSRVLSPAFWLNLSLATKMTLMVLVGLTGLVVFFGILSVSAAQQTTARTLQERVLLAQLAASHTDYVLGNAQTLLESAVTRDEFAESAAPAARQQALRETLANSGSLFLQVLLVDSSGDVRAAEPPLAEPNSLRPVLPQVLRDQSFAIMTINLPVRGAATVAAVPWRDAERPQRSDGGLIAVLQLSASEISAPVQKVTLGATGYLEIVDSSGLVVLSTRPHRRLSIADHGESFEAMIRGGTSVVTNCHNCHTTNLGSERESEVIAFAPLKRAPWGVVIRQAESEVFADANRLQGQIVLLGVLSIIGAAVLVWLTTHSVIAPVQDLTAAAQRIARGDLETPIQVKRGDEIGTLASSLDDMRARLGKSITQVHTLNRDLDARVHERTRELSALNAVAVAVAQSLHLRELLDQALAQVLRVMDVQAGAIFLLDEETRALNLQARCGAS